MRLMAIAAKERGNNGVISQPNRASRTKRAALALVATVILSGCIDTRTDAEIGRDNRVADHLDPTPTVAPTPGSSTPKPRATPTSETATPTTETTTTVQTTTTAPATTEQPAPSEEASEEPETPNFTLAPDCSRQPEACVGDGLIVRNSPYLVDAQAVNDKNQDGDPTDGVIYPHSKLGQKVTLICVGSSNAPTGDFSGVVMIEVDNSSDGWAARSLEPTAYTAKGPFMGYDLEDLPECRGQDYSGGMYQPS